MQVIVSGQVWIRKETVGAGLLHDLREDLTIERRRVGDFDDGENEPLLVRLYSENDHYFGVPRAYWFNSVSAQHEYRWDVSLGTSIRVTSILKHEGVYAEQQRAIDFFMQRYDAIRGNAQLLQGGKQRSEQVRGFLGAGGILRAKTAWGKTSFSLGLVAKLGVTTLIVVHKEFLLRQWVRRIEKFLPGAKVGIVQEDRCDFEGKDIVIAMVHSLALDDQTGGRYPSELYSWPGLIITDETHRISAQSFSVVPPRFSSIFRLGISATVRRKDGTERVFFDHIGKIVFEAKTPALTATVRQKKYIAKFDEKVTSGDLKSSVVLSILAHDRKRNRFIAGSILEALNHPSKRKVFVLSHRLEQLEILAEMIQRHPDCPEDLTVGYYTGAWFWGEARNVLRRGSWTMNAEGRAKAILTLYQSLSRRRGGGGRIEEKAAYCDPSIDEEEQIEGRAHIVVLSGNLLGVLDRYQNGVPQGEEPADLPPAEVVLESLTDDEIFALAERGKVRQERKRNTRPQTEADLFEAERARLVMATYQMCVSSTEEFRDPITGERTTIRKVFDDLNFPNVVAGRGCFSIKKPTRVYINGMRSCVRVTTASGRSRVVTRDHRMWTPRGWVEAAMLIPGAAREKSDHLAFPGCLEVDCIKSDLSPDDAWLIGLLVADGSLSQPKSGSFHLTTNDEELVEQANAVLRQHRMKLVKVRHQNWATRSFDGKNGAGRKTWLRLTVERLGLDRTAHFKRVPREIMLGELDVAAAFVAGYFDGDGCIDKRGVISFDSVSSELLEQTRTLLLRLGIPVITNLAVSPGNCYRLSLPRWVSAKFREIIPSRLPRKIDRVDSLCGRRLSLGLGNAVPPYYVDQLRAEIRRNGYTICEAVRWCSEAGLSASSLLYLNGELPVSSYCLIASRLSFVGEYDKDIVWDRVVSVEDVGEMEVGDFSVPPDQSWCFNGAIVHNCEEGLDLPPIDTMVLATPHGDIEQTIGRGRRFCVPQALGGVMSTEDCEHYCPWRHEGCRGKAPLMVLDVVDVGVALSEKRSRYRANYYRAENFRTL